MNRSISKYSPDPKLRPSTRFGAMLLAMLAVAGVVTPLVTTQVQAQTNNGVTVTPSTLAFDEGTSDSYTVVLDTQPAGDVIIDVTPNFYSSSPSTVSISETMLTFTADNWASPQTVTITALEDSDTRDLRFDINHPVSGYPGVTRVQSVEVEIYDDDEPKIRLSNPRPKVNEGGSVTYTVWMNTRPSHQKLNMIPFSYSDKITVYPTSLEFTNENWRTPQTITITAAHDEDAIDDVFEVMHSFGSGYASGRTTFARVTAIDDEKSRVMTYPTSLTIEAGETERYWVSLDDLPYVNDVTVTITSDNPAVTVNPSTLTFTRATWTRSKGVYVTASDGPATLTHTMSGYDPVKTLKVSVPGGTGTTTTTTTPVTTTTPDLEMGTVVVSDENLSSGSHFTLLTSVTNEGDGDSEATTIRFYRSTDSTITSSDTQQSSSPVIPLAAQGQEVTAISVSLTAPSEEGTYYYGSCVDSVTGETDTADNCSASVTVTVTATVTVNRPATGAPTISGTAQVGQTLTASTSAITDPDGLTNVSYSYQWLADDTEIDGATNSTYTPQTTDIGKVIKVRVTFTDDGDNDEQLTSAAYPGSGTIIAATTKRPVRPVAPTKVTTDPAKDPDTDADNDADADSDSDTEPDTDTDTGDGDESQGGENRIDCDDLETQTPFVEVLESSSEAQAIACIYALGITTGTSPTTYSPGADVSRAQMASFLARLYKALTGTDAPIADTPFTDVVTTSSTYDDIGRVYGLGITTGTSPTTYSPGADVTRAQMASFLARLYKALTGTDAPIADTPFTDVVTTSSAYNDIGRIYGLGITTGTSPTTYSPAANVTRAQMASFLARLYKATTGTEAP